ncbi:hypothetical protein B0J11DRAFT_511191 [Dendryphion nanum]|uniref:Uncharacterized protein n=1 Tax=Dendryphion nanum TaxID=256645 RepID=A0A9P9D6E0_9PLEO|nr:hypothetical protein B0J11DRAFT_511191 [Dendryphion nanum]
MTAPPQIPPILPSFFPVPVAVSTATSDLDLDLDLNLDLTSSWPSMAPSPFAIANNAPQQQRKSNTPSSNEGASKVVWITGTNPDDFKKRHVMTKIRKKAMASHLDQKRPKQNASKEPSRPRQHSEGSTASRASVGSNKNADDITPTSEALRMYYSKQSSPAKSPGPTLEQQAAFQNAEIAAALSTIGNMVYTTPIVQPPRTHIPLEYDLTALRPFQSIGKPLDPFRTMFNPSNPRISVEDLKFHCSRVFGTKAMGQYWIPTLVKSPHAFLSTLCIASAHLDAINERAVESVQTLALRQEVMHLISQNLLQPHSKVDDFNVIALTQLIASEMIAGEEGALGYHQKGVEAMVNARGGVDKLGVNGRVGSTLSWVSLQSAILREARPQAMYINFCAPASSKTYPTSATIPESPLHRPRNDFETLKRSPRNKSETLELLKDVKFMTDLFLHETKNSRMNVPTLVNLYRKITTEYKSISELQRQGIVVDTRDWVYEAVRLAALIQAEAIMRRIPLSSTLKHLSTPTEPHLQLQIYSSIYASRSNESLISPTNLRHDSPVTNHSTSPIYASASAFAPSSSTSPDWSFSNSQQSFNPGTSFSFAPSRPSIASTTSSLSEPSYFPSFSAQSTTQTNTSYLGNLQTALQNSNLSDCWGDYAGVLLWVALIAAAASRKADSNTKILKKWYAALSVRCSIMLCFEHPDPIQAALLRMTELVQALDTGAGEDAEEQRRRESSLGSSAGVGDGGSTRKQVMSNAMGKRRRRN